MPPFTPSRPLLNPQFEGYKLSFRPSLGLRHIQLPHRATQSRTGTHALGFQQVASRVRHNHLAVGDDGALYVAEDGSVVLVRSDERYGDLHEKEDGVAPHVVFHLPESVSTSPHGREEYPGAAYVTRNTWMVSDGHGRAYLLRIPASASDGTTAQLLASWELFTDAASLIPFQLHSAALVSPDLGLAILSGSTLSTIYTDAMSSPKTKIPPTFDVWAVRIPLPEHSSASPADPTPAQFEVAWRRRGAHVPLFTAYVPTRDAFLVIGGSSYHDVAAPPASQPYEPTPEELAPVPRADENLEFTTPGRVSPYSWTQTDDAVTLAFAVPGNTPKTSIHATFETLTLSLRVGSPPLPQPLYAAAPLWDSIHPASSIWTWERGNADTAGLLTLHLDKAHLGTRWSHVFAQGFEPYEVPETVDPSEFASIRENLDKYTASLQNDANGLGHGVPSLAEGERDNEVDASIGNSVILTWVGNDGSTSGATDDAPAVLLSLPLPGAKGPLSLVIKNDIDGPLYTLGEAGWTHVATYSALAFVLASKRDTRFTFHVSSTAALAFESGARNDGGGNVYVYYGSAPGDKRATQTVFQQQAGAGALLGVGSIISKTGHEILLCLSERELIVCRRLLKEGT